MKTFLAATLLALAGAGTALAGGTYDSTGMIMGQSSSVAHPIADGHVTVALISDQNEFKMDAADHPFNGMSGNCVGSMEVRGGSATGGGMCFYNAGQPDSAVNRWTVDAVDATGTLHGRWVMVGGTGAMAGLTGGGTFASSTDQSTGAQTIALTGAVSKP